MPPATSQPSNPASDFCAVLVLDANGRITAVNRSGQELWPARPLPGEMFPALFVFEVTSTEPGFLEAQWEVLLASAKDSTTVLTIAAEPLGAAREMRVCLEARTGTDPGYIATIRPLAAEPPASADSGASDPGAGLRLLVESGDAGYFDLDLQQGRIFLSPSWKRILGYAAPELPDTIETWRQLIHPDDSAAAPDKVGRRIPAGPRPIRLEFRMKHRCGHWVWIECTGLQIVGSPGHVDRVIGLHLDVTERKELEDALVANDARLQDLSGPGPLAAFELDLAHQCFWYSPAWAKLLGYEEDEAPATLATFGAALPAEEAAAGVAEWFLSRAPGQTTFLEPVRLQQRNGHPLRFLLGAHRTISRKRELQRVVGFCCPLSAEAAAAEDSLPPTLVDEAFGTLAEGVLIADAQGRILFLNQVACRLLRVEASAVHGQPVGDVFRLVNRESGRPAVDPIDAAISADQPLPLISSDALAPAREGEKPSPVVWTARIANAADGKAAGVVIVFRDPDEMTLTPEELVRANRFEALGLLAGGIAHDFNNLLTTILGAVTLGTESHDYSRLPDAEKACLTAKGLTKQLLAFAKGGAGTLLVCPARPILEDSIKIAAAATTAVITLEVADDVHNVLVDRGQILQVFQNLIVNALQAMPPPPHAPRLQIRAGNIALADNQVPGLAAGDYVEFEVRDNGTGIKPEHVAKIFDPFFTTKKHGTGLGLATVLSVVRKHGGQIGLDTQIGVGTAFTVYLPKAEQPVEVQARRAASLRFGTGRILFMDDDPNILALTATMLQSLDYKYDLAKNGEEALVLYKRYLNIGRPYDAVIMDLTVVGGMGGEECFEELRKLDPEVRAIVASGYDLDEMARQFLERGFCGYLTKPYRAADLGKVLKTVLG